MTKDRIDTQKLLKQKNRALLFVLIMLCAIFYLITLLKFKTGS